MFFVWRLAARCELVYESYRSVPIVAPRTSIVNNSKEIISANQQTLRQQITQIIPRWSRQRTLNKEELVASNKELSFSVFVWIVMAIWHASNGIEFMIHKHNEFKHHPWSLQTLPEIMTGKVRCITEVPNWTAANVCCWLWVVSVVSESNSCHINIISRLQTALSGWKNRIDGVVRRCKLWAWKKNMAGCFFGQSHFSQISRSRGAVFLAPRW